MSKASPVYQTKGNDQENHLNNGGICSPPFSFVSFFVSLKMRQTFMFKKHVENFICEHCGAENIGDGFTNHCAQCLWSKHVDVDPGDRAATCSGMMKPVSVEGIVGKYDLIFVCETCGHTKKNKVSDRDNFTAVLQIANAKK